MASETSTLGDTKHTLSCPRLISSAWRTAATSWLHLSHFSPGWCVPWSTLCPQLHVNSKGFDEGALTPLCIVPQNRIQWSPPNPPTLPPTPVLAICLCWLGL